MKICICGGGNLGHVVSGFLAAKGQCRVSLLTRHPNRWSRSVNVNTPDDCVLTGTIDSISDNPSSLIPDANVVLLCLPGFAIQDELLRIKPFLMPRTAVGSVVSSTGFFFEAMKHLPPTTPLFGFQRVPFIARVVEYGKTASLLGFKDSLSVAIEQTEEKESLRSLLEQLLHTPFALLSSHYEASLTNSNPLLHPARLYNLWSDWHEGVVYPSQSFFYKEWTDEASELLLAMDREFFQLLRRLPVRENCIPTILNYYESSDAPSLTRKLRSIQAFKDILSPMKKVENGYIPDFASRYFMEDFPYGLGIVWQLAKKYQVNVPFIDRVMAWGRSCIELSDATV